MKAPVKIIFAGAFFMEVKKIFREALNFKSFPETTQRWFLMTVLRSCLRFFSLIFLPNAR
jgi:hypothetical protein